MRQTFSISIIVTFLFLGSCSQNSSSSSDLKMPSKVLSKEDFQKEINTTAQIIEKIFLKEKDVKARLSRILEVQKTSKLNKSDFRKVITKVMLKMKIPTNDQKLIITALDSSKIKNRIKK